MSVVYSTAVKTAIMTAARDYHANGTLEIQTSGGAVLATFGLDAAGGTVSGAVWTLVFDAATVAASGSGTAAKAVVKNSGGTVGITDALTVGTSGTDIVLDSVSITSGQDVSLTSATITHN